MKRLLIRNKPQRILITGDRDWTDRPKMIEVLSKHLRPDRDIVIHGDARGADRMGTEVAKELGIAKDRILAYPADWEKYHRAAGHIRNQQMLTEGNPTLVLAFHYDIMASKGTRDMVTRTLFAKLPTYLNGTPIFSLPPARG